MSPLGFDLMVATSGLNGQNALIQIPKHLVCHETEMHRPRKMGKYDVHRLLKGVIAYMMPKGPVILAYNFIEE